MTRESLLALETSGGLGSVAVAVEGVVRARRFLPTAREHAARILPAIAEVLAEVGTRTTELGGVVVGAGPGSYTGVRVAAATAKGMVHALGIPLFAVSSLRAAALTGLVLSGDTGPWDPIASPPDARLRVLFDARGRRLFSGWYQRREGDAVSLIPDGFTTLDALLADPEVEGAAVCGDGAERHRDELTAAGCIVLPPPEGVPTADALLATVVKGRVDPVSSPWEWEPDYLRATGAERLASVGGAESMG